MGDMSLDDHRRELNDAFCRAIPDTEPHYWSDGSGFAFHAHYRFLLVWDSHDNPTVYELHDRCSVVVENITDMVTDNDAELWDFEEYANQVVSSPDDVDVGMVVYILMALDI
jgi:hypothetical protein